MAFLNIIMVAQELLCNIAHFRLKKRDGAFSRPRWASTDDGPGVFRGVGVEGLMQDRTSVLPRALSRFTRLAATFQSGKQDGFFLGNMAQLAH
jgi:hypothetical protein